MIKFKASNNIASMPVLPLFSDEYALIVRVLGPSGYRHNEARWSYEYVVKSNITTIFCSPEDETLLLLAGLKSE